MNLKGLNEMKHVKWCRPLDKPCEFVTMSECMNSIPCRDCSQQCTMILADTYYVTLKYLYKEM